MTTKKYLIEVEIDDERVQPIVDAVGEVTTSDFIATLIATQYSSNVTAYLKVKHVEEVDQVCRDSGLSVDFSPRAVREYVEAGFDKRHEIWKKLQTLTDEELEDSAWMMLNNEYNLGYPDLMELIVNCA